MATYNKLNPTPQSGSGPYGSVPGVLSMPDNLYSQVNKANPGFQATGNNASKFIGSEVNGQLSPEMMDLIQNKGAQFGVTSGMPGSQFATNNYLKNLGLTAESLQQKGTADYLNFLTGVGGTLDDPKMSYEVQVQNALDAAAPNPGRAAGVLQGNVMSGYRAGAGGGFNIPGGGAGGWIPPAGGTTGYDAGPAAMVGYGPGYGTPDPSTQGVGFNAYGGNKMNAFTPNMSDNFDYVYSDYGSQAGEQQPLGERLQDYFDSIYAED